MVRTLCVIALSISCVVHAQPGKIDSLIVPKPLPHFIPEYTLDAPTDLHTWQQLSHGMHVSFGSTDRAYFRSEVPLQNEETKSLRLTGWRGERLNAMILIWSPDTIEQVRFSVKDLKATNGRSLKNENVSLQLVRYVLSNDPYDASDVYCGEDQLNKVYLMPDRLESFERFDLPGRSARPVWLSLDIPANAAAGVYKGTITVSSKTQSSMLELQVKVQRQLLPRPHDWAFRLDLWQNPWIVALYNDVEPWSPEHIALLKKHLKLYADAGGKFTTANVVHSVWADETYGSLVGWIKERNGTWRFDYNYFDQYVQLAIDEGVDKAISIYSPIPYGESFRYMNEATGNYVTERWSPTSDTFRRNWNIFLADLKKHLEKKGWFSRTYIGINENGPEQTMAAINMVKNQSREWKITYAGDWHAGLDTLLNDYCSLYGKEPPVENVLQRSASHRTTTYYVCCTPPKPNNFVFSPPVEGRWIGWYTFAHAYDGFLRWAYDSWPADVVHDARNTHWNGPAGDCYMLYPGGKSSIRFEKLREGIVDYEKLRILKSDASKSNNAEVKKKWKELEQHLSVIDRDKELKKEKLEADLLKGTALVDQLSDLLGALSTKNK